LLFKEDLASLSIDLLADNYVISLHFLLSLLPRGKIIKGLGLWEIGLFPFNIDLPCEAKLLLSLSEGDLILGLLTTNFFESIL
jgi:hypothetical protein